MPIYEYQCSQCGEVFEAFQKITDKPLTQCKFCRGKVEKMISHTSFQLKGTGWYLTDYARKSQPSGNSSSSSGESKASDKADSGAEKSQSAPAKAEKKPT